MSASTLEMKQAVTEQDNSAIPSWVDSTALGAIIIGGIGTLLGLFLLNSQEAWWMLLVNFLFWGGVAQGMVVWNAILRTCQASWAAGANRIGFSALHYLLFTLVLFIILWIGREQWLTWLTSPVPKKAAWLNDNFFFARNAIALLFLTGLSYLYVARYQKLDRLAGTPDSDKAQGSLNKLAIGLVGAYVLIYSLFAFDLVMSLEPYWYSTLFGAYYFVGNIYAAVAAMILVSAFVRKPLGLRKYLGSNQFSDMGNLMMGFGILFSGFVFAQWLTIWYGNLPEEATYIYTRLYLFPWKGVSIALLVLIIFGPFLLLQSRAAKASPRRLSWIALMVFVGMLIERWILVVPAWTPERLAGIEPVTWFIPVLCAGVFVKVVLTSLRKNPQVSSLDLELKAEH